MKTKFIYVVLMALFLGSQMTLSAQNKENKERKQHPSCFQLPSCKSLWNSFQY